MFDRDISESSENEEWQARWQVSFLSWFMKCLLGLTRGISSAIIIRDLK